jgi:hypothetical protein
LELEYATVTNVQRAGRNSIYLRFTLHYMAAPSTSSVSEQISKDTKDSDDSGLLDVSLLKELGRASLVEALNSVCGASLGGT